MYISFTMFFAVFWYPVSTFLNPSTDIVLDFIFPSLCWLLLSNFSLVIPVFFLIVSILALVLIYVHLPLSGNVHSTSAVWVLCHLLWCERCTLSLFFPFGILSNIDFPATCRQNYISVAFSNFSDLSLICCTSLPYVIILFMIMLCIVFLFSLDILLSCL